MALSPHQFKTYYHGTSKRNASSIMKHGLQVSNPMGEADEEESGYPTGVYLSDDIRIAKEYGDAVFSVDLPDSADWGDTVGDGHVLNHNISPFALRRVE